MLKQRTIFAGITLFLTLFINSCKDKELIPSYVYIDAVQLNTNTNQGSKSHKIYDVWVYLNDQLVAIDELPAIIPVLGEGNQTINVRAGIMNNGINATRIAYPFYTVYTTTLNLKPTEIDTIRPVFTYYNNTQFSFVDDFDAFGSIFGKDLDGDADSRLQIDLNGFENASGKIVLTDDHNLIEVATTRQYEIPANFQEAYLELDYKNTMPFSIGIIGYDSNGNNSVTEYIILLNEKQDWNKTYLSLNDALRRLNKVKYEVVVRALKTSTQTTAEIYLDNIKLLYR